MGRKPLSPDGPMTGAQRVRKHRRRKYRQLAEEWKRLHPDNKWYGMAKLISRIRA